MFMRHRRERFLDPQKPKEISKQLDVDRLNYCLADIYPHWLKIVIVFFCVSGFVLYWFFVRWELSIHSIELFMYQWFPRGTQQRLPLLDMGLSLFPLWNGHCFSWIPLWQIGFRCMVGHLSETRFQLWDKNSVFVLWPIDLSNEPTFMVHCCSKRELAHGMH